MREWFMIAKMGSYMEIIKRLSGKTITEPLLWIGSNHSETMLAKFAGLGIHMDIVSPGQESMRSKPKLLHGLRRSIAYTDAVRNAVTRIER